MYNRDLEKRYFNWLVNAIDENDNAERYKHLLHKLHETDYKESLDIPLDANRYDDAIQLRYRFGEDNGVPEFEITFYLDIRECSMLEMLVALSIRIEESGMGIPYEGIHPGKWFWMFIENIGYFKAPFDDVMIDRQTRNFLDHKFNPDGSNGGLVVVPGNRDLRRMDIWYQVNLYLSTLID